MVLSMRPVGVINLMFFFFVHSLFEGENPILCDFVKKTFNIGWYSDIYRQFSFQVDMMIEITKLYTLISLWMTWTFIQGHSCMRNKKK